MAFNKQKALKIVNPVVAAIFITQATGGIFHDAIPYEIFSKVHGLGGYLLVAAIGTHVVLNWSWFKTAFAKKKIKT
jgi:hypothetical protein